MGEVRTERLGRLSPDQVRDVMSLVEAATDVDGVNPLSEHVLLHLKHGGDAPAANLLALDGDRAVGYAHLDSTDVVEGASAEVVVHPDERGRGVGTALVKALPSGRLRLWAHGQHPAAAALAKGLGFEQSRVLWQMRRSLYAPLPAPQWPDGVTVRTFVVGQDEDDWVRVNARAFEKLPDQGSWTCDDLIAREKEPWFDPAGFFIAERDGAMIGFHWTKVHGADNDPSAHGHQPVGEVYVVGVDPDAQGIGLGPALTLTGLRHLRARGLPSVMLYVDEANTNAIGVYERLGFSRWDTDVSYRRADTSRS
ncbi:MAG: mycothiol synthase [Frankiales bacterium]|jgi:mycothiol synthase|nr:mycothiol synthase [Frankiales bacterium]